MSLNNLSDDLLLDILDIVWALPWNVVSTHNIALCSKRFNKLATPLIYKMLDIGTWNQDTLLLRTLLETPSLGTFCTSLTTQWYGHIASTRNIEPDELALCKSRIELFCDSPDEVEKWLEHLQYKEWEASASLLLSCLPNVEKLEISQYEKPASEFFDRVLERAAMLQSQGSDSPLALSKLAFINGSFDTWTDLNVLKPFLRLKSVKTAEFKPTVDHNSLPVETPTFELDSLILGVVIDGAFSRLDGFLSNFKTLKTFRLIEDDFERDPCFESGPHTLDDAISGLKHCLEELEINQSRRAPEDLPWISSLAEFQTLRKISIDASVVFKPNHKPRNRNIDVLPPSLESLELFTYDQYVVDQLLRILEQKHETVPKLTDIQLKRRSVKARNENQVARFQQSIEDLKEQCKDAGITLKFFEEAVKMGVNSRSTIWTQVD